MQRSVSVFVFSFTTFYRRLSNQIKQCYAKDKTNNDRVVVSWISLFSLVGHTPDSLSNLLARGYKVRVDEWTMATGCVKPARYLVHACMQYAHTQMGKSCPAAASAAACDPQVWCTCQRLAEATVIERLSRSPRRPPRPNRSRQAHPFCCRGINISR